MSREQDNSGSNTLSTRSTSIDTHPKVVPNDFPCAAVPAYTTSYIGRTSEI
jgi:hypothetical protein